MKIFNFLDYKAFIRKKLAALPARGRGEITRIAKHLSIHNTMVTHILKGNSHLTMEQSLKIADYFSFNTLETEYLVSLVLLERAGDKKTKEFCLNKVNEIRALSLNLKHRLEVKNQLSETDRAFYYSSWIYSMIRLLTAIPRFQTIESLAKELQLPSTRINTALEFLLSRGLCIEENNKIKYGSIPTYLEASSPLASRHHLNWRQKSQEKFEQIRSEDLAITLPCVLSEEDAQKIREKIVQMIEEVKKTYEPSPSEELYILNVDWIKLNRQ